jgi:predicted anti-sigma-YlaC factor YlaD
MKKHQYGQVVYPLRFLVVISLSMFLLTGCSIRRLAINQIGDALASGGDTYSSDDDLILVGEALPFGLKLMESLLEESPSHRGLLITACEGFTTYAYIYVQHKADIGTGQDLTQAREMRTRARRLYLRARAYGLRRLEASYKGITERIQADPRAALSVIKKEDVPALYWNAAALGLGISVSKNDAEMLAQLPEVEALLERALELDEGWNQGALHSFQVTLASAKPGQPDYRKLREHFDRALDLSGGNQAGLYVAYAEAVSISNQDRSEFVSLLNQALAIDPDQHKDVRLANIVAQQRARWLLGRVDDLILDTTSVSEGRISND